MSAAFAMNSYRGKQILALVRDGDYAHAGEEEAIEIALAGIPKENGRPVLDAGCGRGGTAAYMAAHGWGSVTGIDIEPNSVEYARQTFPHLAFAACDILDAANHVPAGFSLVTLFNVLYTLPDQAAALRALAGVAKPGATLTIFDYIDRGGYRDVPVMDAGKPFLPRPPMTDDIEQLLNDGGWTLQSVTDLTAEYERWYTALVAKIAAKREAITAFADADAYEHVRGRYAGLLAAIRDGRLGGAVILGEKRAC